jgi:hypothetical protein
MGSANSPPALTQATREIEWLKLIQNLPHPGYRRFSAIRLSATLSAAQNTITAMPSPSYLRAL